MATKKDATSAAAVASEEDVKVVNEQKFTLESLKKHSIRLFGVPTVVFAGATANLENKEYTVGEIKSIIKKWCRQEVK